MTLDEARARRPWYEVTEPNTAILLTPPGSAAIATVRLSGPQVEPFLLKHFSTTTSPERCVHGILRDGERVIDDPVVVMHDGAYTADINLHGGTWVVRSMLKLAADAGFEVNERVSLPLADEAVDSADVIEREALTHLPLARTEQAIRVLLNQPAAWKGVERLEKGALQAMLDDRSLHWLLHSPTVAIVGVPNVGKSTIANALSAQERSIVADLPGTTRDWVGEIANIDGLAVMLVDTPGDRATGDAIESQAIAQSRGKIAAADLVIVVVDPTQDQSGQENLLARHAGAMVVANKSDRVPMWRLGSREAINTVASTCQGIEDVRRAIRARFGCENLDPGKACCWTERQRQIIQKLLSV